MDIDKQNWLKLLRNDILKRGTLYIDREDDIEELTSTNWLKLLRNDIIQRQTLHPHGDTVGVITKNNFLTLLRDDLLKEQEEGIIHEEWPLIPNPFTSTNFWMKGEKGRTADNQRWISLIDFNVWQPSEHPQGWKKVE